MSVSLRELYLIEIKISISQVIPTRPAYNDVVLVTPGMMTGAVGKCDEIT